jgi:hypothetical protein
MYKTQGSRHIKYWSKQTQTSVCIKRLCKGNGPQYVRIMNTSTNQQNTITSFITVEASELSYSTAKCTLMKINTLNVPGSKQLMNCLTEGIKLHQCSNTCTYFHNLYTAASMLGLTEDTNHREKIEIRLHIEFSMSMMLITEQYSLQGFSF